MDRKTRSTGRQRKGPRRPLRPWEPRLAVVTLVAATLAGPFGATAAIAAAPVAPSGDRIQSAAPASAVALAVIGLAILAWLVVAAHRHRHRAPAAEEVTTVLPASVPPFSDLDLDRIVTGARAQAARAGDGRGSQADDRSPEEPASPAARTLDAPVWVRRLDGRIPIMPTHQNVPVDNDRPASRRGRAGPRWRRGRDA